jgi:hypothetical protein
MNQILGDLPAAPTEYRMLGEQLVALTQAVEEEKT